jgi:hypothetical protein
MGLVGIYNGSAFRVAARFTAFALTGFRAKPFFHELSSDQDFVGLQHILFEAIGIDAFFGQADDNAGLTERVVELLYGLFNFLLRSTAPRTGLFLLIKQPLPFNNKRLHPCLPPTKSR